MNIKKILIAILCIGLSLTLVGCGNQNTTNAVANNLDKNTAQLETVLNNIEDINYKDIIIEDISPLSDETFNTVSDNKILQKTKWYSVNGNAASNFIPTKTKNQKNNARYVNKTYKKIGLSEPNSKNTVKKIYDIENGPNSKTEFTSSNFKTYTPKYINNVTENFNRDLIDNYLNKIEIIYGECADCIGCNAECQTEKIILQQNIADCRTLIRKMRDGTIQLSEADIQNCNDCMKSLNENINRLNSTKNNVKIKEKIVKDLKNNFTGKQDELESAYSKLLNALENRLDCLSECNENLNCICNTINYTNIDITEALKNKSDQKDIKNYEENENNQQNYTLQNDQSYNYENNSNNLSQNNQSTQNINGQGKNYGNMYNANQPYNQNGYYNYGMNQNYGNYYNQNYPYMPRNIDTYGIINKNIDTYSNIQNNNNYDQNENYKTENSNNNTKNDNTKKTEQNLSFLHI